MAANFSSKEKILDSGAHVSVEDDKAQKGELVVDDTHGVTPIQDIKTLTRLADDAYAAKHYAQALSVCNLISTIQPKNVTAHELAAFCFARLEQYPSAIAICNIVFELNPQNTNARLCRAYALYEMGRPEEALADYDQYLTAYPSDTGAYEDYLRASRAIIRAERVARYVSDDVAESAKKEKKEQTDTAESKAALAPSSAILTPEGRLIIKTSNSSFLVHCNNCYILYVSGRYKEALIACDAALAIEPKSIWAHYNRGLILTELRQCVEADAAYRAALAIAKPTPVVAVQVNHLTCDMETAARFSHTPAFAEDPCHAAIYRGRAFNFYMQKQYEEALEYLNKAVRLNPKDAHAHFYLGEVSLAKAAKRGNLAEEKLKLAFSNNADTSRERDESKAARDTYLATVDQAFAAFDRALSIKPRFSSEVHYFLAETLFNSLQDNERALAAYDKFLALRPRHRQGQYNRALVLMRLGRCRESIAAWDKVLLVCSKRADIAHIADIHGYQGHLFFRLKEYQEALAAYGKVLVIEPQNWIRQLDYAETLTMLGRHEEALVLYQKMLTIDEARYAPYAKRTPFETFQKRASHGVSTTPDKITSQERLAAYDAMLAADPRNAGLHHERSRALFTLERLAEAVQSCLTALTLDKDMPYRYENARSDFCKWTNGTYADYLLKKTRVQRTVTGFEFFKRPPEAVDEQLKASSSGFFKKSPKATGKAMPENEEISKLVVAYLDDPREINSYSASEGGCIIA